MLFLRGCDMIDFVVRVRDLHGCASLSAIRKRGDVRMTNTELLCILLSIASLLLTLYFGLR